MLNILIGNKYIWYKLKRINLIYSNYYSIVVKKIQLHKIQKAFQIPYECTKTLMYGFDCYDSFDCDFHIFGFV